MRGLIYKDISIFFKSIDKKLILIAAVAIVLLIFNAGIYAGLFASVMFAMTIGMQNIMSFLSILLKNFYKRSQKLVEHMALVLGK